MRVPFFSTIFTVCFLGLVSSTPLFAQANGLASLQGTVVDAETGRPVIGAIISVEAILDEQNRQSFRIGPTGVFRFLLDPKKNYYILTEASGYQPTKEKFIITSGYTIDIHGKVINLKKGGPITAPVASPATSKMAVVTPPPPPAVTAQTTSTSTVVAPPSAVPQAKPRPAVPAPARPVTVQTVQTELKAVQFVQSRAELLPESQPALDQLLTFMRENPTVTIELAGHTDNQGDYDQNLLLSKQRVELVKTFLVQHGIEATRITSRGYGSTRPIASNNSEATRRLNRRVELVILTK